MLILSLSDNDSSTSDNDKSSSDNVESLSVCFIGEQFEFEFEEHYIYSNVRKSQACAGLDLQNRISCYHCK